MNKLTTRWRTVSKTFIVYFSDPKNIPKRIATASEYAQDQLTFKWSPPSGEIMNKEIALLMKKGGK